MITGDKLLPSLPPETPWTIRELCYAVRKLPRGYGRILPVLARVVPSLQEVVVDSEDCGPICLDFRELVCHAVFVNGCYEHQLPQDRVLDHLIRPGMTLFDIGANIGYYTAFMSRRVGQSGRVIAVEPMPRALRLLKKTSSLGRANVAIESCAIGPEPGHAQIREMRKLDVSFVRFGEEGTSGVPVTTIDELTRKYGRPDIVKIDVEGAELEAFGGASSVLTDSKPPIVMFEYIAENAAHFGSYQFGELLKFFPQERFAIYRIMVPGQLLAIPEPFEEPVHDFEQGRPATNDYLAVPRERTALVEPLMAAGSVEPGAVGCQLSAVGY